MLNETLADYDPYPSEGYAGDVEAAMEEMKLSKYDTDKDGICDAPECKDVLYVTEADRLRQDMQPPIERVAREDRDHAQGALGRGRLPGDPGRLEERPDRPGGPGWGKDYADASTFMVLFDSRSTHPDRQHQLLARRPHARAGGRRSKASGTIEGIPSVDADIDACNLIPVGDERVQCWADLDKKLMEEVVPWIPYLDATAIARSRVRP